MNEAQKQLVEELGIATMPQEDQLAMLQDFVETLNMRLAMAVEDQLDDEQMKQFAAVEAKGDDSATEEWLHQQLPNYDEIVEAEAQKLKQDILRTKQQIHDAVQPPDSE
ncbi:MAG: hypothetical protein QG629_600 [Patescibacteria group bacterium]|nr:hypothetical protein [Candidatus Saccharibacteria bacterium]MDQ5963518.1 hypothetical protein [Patescibacteria group bacterium]